MAGLEGVGVVGCSPAPSGEQPGEPHDFATAGALGGAKAAHGTLLRKGVAAPLALQTGSAPLTPPAVSGHACAPLMEPFSPVAYAASASAKKGAELFGSSRLGPPSMRDAKGTRSLDRKSTLRPLAAPGRLANPGPKLREPFGLQAPSIGGATLHTAKTHRRLPSMDEAPKDLNLVVEGVAVVDVGGGGGSLSGVGALVGGASASGAAGAGGSHKAAGGGKRVEFEEMHPAHEDPGFSPPHAELSTKRESGSHFAAEFFGDGAGVAARGLDLEALRLDSPALTDCSSPRRTPNRDPLASPLGRLRLCSDSRGSCGRLWTQEELAELNSLPSSRGGVTPSSADSLGAVSPGGSTNPSPGRPLGDSGGPPISA